MKAIDYEEESTKRGNWLDITGGGAKDSLTVLDYFAAKAMDGLLASPRSPNTENPRENITAEIIAMHAYAVAEAMLAERNKRYTPQGTIKGVTGKTYGHN